MFKFENVIGQDAVKQKLLHSFSENRIPHALLLNGSEGHGALALAMALASFLLCENKGEVDSCGSCKSCKAMHSLQHPDLHFSFPFINTGSSSHETISDEFGKEWRELLLDSTYFGLEAWQAKISKDNKQLSFLVGESKNIARKVSLKSFYNGPKIMVIWMAELIKEDTANKLLKLLEEPPAQTIFILVTQSTSFMLPTVLSRVQSIQIPRLDDNVILQFLSQNQIPSDKAENATRLADGNLWKAMTLAQNDSANNALDEFFQKWMRCCYKKDMVSLNDLLKEFESISKDVQIHFLSYALEQVRQNLLLNYVGESLIRLNDRERAFSNKFSAYINHFNIDDLLKVISESQYYLERNVNVKLVFLQLSLKVHQYLNRKNYA